MRCSAGVVLHLSYYDAVVIVVVISYDPGAGRNNTATARTLQPHEQRNHTNNATIRTSQSHASVPQGLPARL
ncbi:hypothetical protein [Actinobaculum suis]|uniref:hypothetical protein n=1 Tax=Actinobaculum suis TaxID=1657 RepID=UPI0012E10BFF|nr:hypothetical protein [Actinobaculum suis]